MVRAAKLLRIVILCGLTLSTLALAATNNETQVTYPSAFGVSQRFADLPINYDMFPTRVAPEPKPGPLASRAGTGLSVDTALQTEVLPQTSATQGISFDGIAQTGWIPPDNNLAVGPNHIVEIVNTSVAMYTKTGTLISGPTNIPTLFAAIGGLCTTYVVDPITLYDRPADRWVISGIGLDYAGHYGECVAVSTTNDPTGSYSLYFYNFGTTLNDYPKLSTWATASNSAYLVTYNLNGGQADICGFDRTKMLAGTANAAQLCKQATGEASYLPGDMDGPTPPPDGTPGLFINWANNNPGTLHLRKLTLNFGSGTASLSSPTSISVNNFNVACFSSCVPQPGTSQMLDVLGDRAMYRFAIRHFSDHDRAVVTHAVLNGSSQVAVRWYELYDPAGSVTVNQQGTFAPDSTYRWMSSAAEDQSGDIGVGYSASSSSVYPSILFTGRVPTDPAGTLETEASIQSGGGSQTGGTYAYRWGDYTAMQVDPSDDCTFWYVNEYEQTTGYENWTTHLASFAFPNCSGGGGGPAMSLTPTSLTWGKIFVGTTAAGKKKVTATNTGTAILSISNIAVTGDFALFPVKQTKKITPCANGTNLNPGASCVIKVSFTPTQTGVRTGSVSFTDNAPNSPQSVALTGKGK
jgi:hypothetical protein